MTQYLELDLFLNVVLGTSGSLISIKATNADLSTLLIFLHHV